ncbi:hypothetical protein [Liquorilactobacillus vini]|uniref:hypothetical protein n=1 Tax=Liquorilactobacillus vini TaxID=238015 RepID=UPI000316ED01|nr:hypothetical protein [Liquorilactobacillus vini]
MFYTRSGFSRIGKSRGIIKELSLYFQDIKTLKSYDTLIVHNKHMKSKIVNMGLNNLNICNLEIFDYLVPLDNFIKEENFVYNKSVAIAGNLSFEKAGYCYNLPSNVDFRLYGVNLDLKLFKHRGNIKYFGSFSPEKIYKVKACFGLVWDGPFIDKCGGLYGNYLKYNDPHKVSLYIAAGLPVIVWSEAAISDFIVQNKIGFKISSLNDLYFKLNSISEEDYKQMKNNVLEISKKIKRGFYTKRVLTNAKIINKH